jgi:hypothetical protein
MKSFCLPRKLLLMSIFENEWVEFPHVDFVDGEMAAEKQYEYSRLETFNRLDRTRLLLLLLRKSLGEK